MTARPSNSARMMLFSGTPGDHVGVQALGLGAVAVVEDSLAVAARDIGFAASAGRKQGDCGDQQQGAGKFWQH